MTQRLFGLDLLRAAAILFVLVDHSRLLLGLPADWGLGALGVQLFFVLSGFLVGRLALDLVDRRETTWPQIVEFWRRRWYRTLPAYYLAVLVCVILDWRNRGTWPPHFASFIVFGQNFYGAQTTFFGASWTLAVEEWFYLLLPLLLVGSDILLGRSRRAIWFAIIAVLVVIPAGRMVYVVTNPGMDDVEWLTTVAQSVPLRLDSLMTGVLGAALARYHPGIWQRWPRSAFWCGLLALGLGHVVNRTAALTLLNAGTLALFPFLSMCNASGSWRGGITWMSRRAYALYLFHAPLLIHGVFLPRTGWDQWVFFLAFTFLLSDLVYRWYEKPIMDLRDRPSILRALT